MKIGHISDLHWLDLSGVRAVDFLNKRLSGGFNLIAGRAKKHTKDAVIAALETLKAAYVDHLLVTGDLTNLALTAEFRSVMATLDRYFDAAHRTIVPGNHDFYTRESARCQRFVEYVYKPYRDAATPRIYADSIDAEKREKPIDEWPFAEIHGDVCIIALNSAEPKPWFVAGGTLGNAQLERLDHLLARPELESRFKIVMLHHHIVRVVTSPGESLRRLKERKQLINTCQKHKVDLIVHGHNHDFSQFKLGETLVSEAGSCSVAHFKRNNRAGKINIYTVENASLQSIETYRYENNRYALWQCVSPEAFIPISLENL